MFGDVHKTSMCKIKDKKLVLWSNYFGSNMVFADQIKVTIKVRLHNITVPILLLITVACTVENRALSVFQFLKSSAYTCIAKQINKA